MTKLTQEHFTRIKNDSNGNPRYVVHYLNVMPESYNDKGFTYAKTCKLMNKIGGRKYHNKSYGGGIVFQSYNLNRTIEQIESLIESVDNLDSSRKYYLYERILLDSADSDGYDTQPLNTDKEKAQFIHDRFMSEYGWHFERNGNMQKSLVEWLQGLALDIPFYNHDIVLLRMEFEGVKELSDKEQGKTLDSYWGFMAMRLIGIFKHFNII